MAASSSSSSAASSATERIRRASDELRASVSELEQAIADDPHDAIARYHADDLISLRCLAQAYVADGRWPEAEATIARAPEAAVMERLGRRDEAIAEWEAIVAWSRAHGNEGDRPEREIARLRA